MLWLALYFPALPLEVFARALPAEVPLALSARGGGREVVVRGNAPAQVAGVRVGMPLPAALAVCPGLKVFARDLPREHDALTGLALWTYQFSPMIVIEARALLLEVGASLRLFGGLDGLMERVAEGAAQLAYEVRQALAPTPSAAGLLARSRQGSRVVDRDGMMAVLGDIPLAQLTRDVQVRRLIADIGLYSIGDCLTLPRAELARRAGPQLLLRLDRLLGDAPDPRKPWQPPQRFGQRIELLAEIEHTQALVFPARRLLQGLCGYLRGRGAAVQSLRWSLQHRDLADTGFVQGLLQPSRHVEHILEILRERLGVLQLPAPVVGIGLHVDEVLDYREHSGALFAAGLPQADLGLLERLRSRLGEHRVQGLCVLPDPRPEHAWCLCEPGQGMATNLVVPPQPPWLLAAPRPLAVHQGIPQYAGPLQLHSGPQRIETGWWDGLDTTRDYFHACNPAGARLWIYRERRSGEWYLHGLFD